MNEDFFGGERIKPNVIKRKADFERPVEKIKPEEGLIAGNILERLRKEAGQIKKEGKTEIVAEKQRLNEIFEKKKDLQ